MISQILAIKGEIMAAEEAELSVQGGALGAARFTGRYLGKVDAKGRVVIPTEFRQRLGASEVYAFPSLTDEVLQLGPAGMVEDLLAAVAGHDVYDEDRWLLEEEITAGVLRLGIDDTGRVSLPKELRAFAKLEGPVGFSGRGWHFVLASAPALDDQRAKAREAALRNKETLRVRMLPSVQAGRKP